MTRIILATRGFRWFFRLFFLGPFSLLFWYFGEQFIYVVPDMLPISPRSPPTERYQEYKSLMIKVVKVQFPFAIVWSFLTWSDVVSAVWYMITVAGFDYILDTPCGFGPNQLCSPTAVYLLEMARELLGISAYLIFVVCFSPHFCWIWQSPRQDHDESPSAPREMV